MSNDAITELRLVAFDPIQLKVAQESLIDWCRQKIASVEVEVSEFQANLKIATDSKWNTKRPKAALSNAIHRQEYYEKIRAAIEAGYYIVPNFPCDIFAIRTDREPRTGVADVATRSYKTRLTPAAMDSDRLQVGVGDYVHPVPKHETTSEARKEGETTKYDNILMISGWQDVDFPFVLAKPQVLTETQRAMALKIFDEVGVCPQTVKSDPMVIGKIRMPAKGRHVSIKEVSFLIAWFLDTKDL